MKDMDLARLLGDLRFSVFDKLVAYVGVHPAEKSSGRKGADPETSWHMSKPSTPTRARRPTAWPWSACNTTP